MQFVSEFSEATASAGETAGSMELLTRNSLTTAGAAVAAGTAVAGTAVLVAALPAQMALASGLSAGLYYAGDRKAKNLPIIPQFQAKPADEKAPAAVEVQPAA